MGPRAFRQVGMMLLSAAPLRVVSRPGILWDGPGRLPPADRNTARPTREQRVQVYAARAAAGLLLFDGTPAHPDPHPRACWGCGRPPGERVSNFIPLPDSWRARVFRCGGSHAVEIYCPDCAPLAELEDAYK